MNNCVVEKDFKIVNKITRDRKIIFCKIDLFLPSLLETITILEVFCKKITHDPLSKCTFSG